MEKKNQLKNSKYTQNKNLNKKNSWNPLIDNVPHKTIIIKTP